MIYAQGVTQEAGAGGISRQGKAWTLLASAVFWLIVLWGLLSSVEMTTTIEPPVIRGERLFAAKVNVEPKPNVRPKSQPVEARPTRPVAIKPTQKSKTSAAISASIPSQTPSRPTPVRVPTIANAPTFARSPTPNMPRIAGSKSARENNVALPNSGGDKGSVGLARPNAQAGPGTLSMLRAQECLKLDINERPADCPSNEALLRLARAAVRLAQEPQYRPENAESFSRNELKWRDIPPPCLEDGVNAGIRGSKLCIRVGTVPSRVRTWQEICEARGLGGCTRPDQAAANRAVKAAKAAQ